MKYVDLKKPASRENTFTIASGKGGPKGSGKGKFIIIGLVVIVIFVVGISTAGPIFAKISSPATLISTVAKVQNNKLKETDGRTNILLLGYDQRENGTILTQLTDTILLISINKDAQDAALISIPRDLWVKREDDTFSKINEVYAYKGAEGTVKSVESVTGLPVHYYLLVNFGMFKSVVDTVGGVEINVEDGFTDYEYPVEGMEAATCGRSEEDAQKMVDDGKGWVEIYPCRYETLVFESGPQIMNGERALKYVRSRHGGNGQGTDFSRAHRQQQLIMAVKDRALTSSVLLDFNKLKSLYDSYSKQTDSNFDLSTLEVFYKLTEKATFGNIKSIVLDTSDDEEKGGLLYSPTDLTLYGGRYVLIPKSGDYSQIHAYIKRLLFI